MINEILFMEIRLFRMFHEKHHLSMKEVSLLFEQFGIWNYIESCYEALHVSGDECALNDIEQILNSKGVQL